jgi:hypothetical protein
MKAKNNIDHKKTRQINARLYNIRLKYCLAILVKSTHQVIGYHLGGAALNLMALYNVHQLAIFK